MTLKNIHKTIIVGFGNQGKKRKKIIKNVIDIVDKNINEKKYKKSVKHIDHKKYSNVFLCINETSKIEYVDYFIKFNKNILVEKPLFSKKNITLNNLRKKNKKSNKTLYVSYNLRFEESIIDLKKYIKKNILGKIYIVNMYYGNGTAINVKNEKWRDKNNGVLNDLGSHLIDLTLFLFGNLPKKKYWRNTALRNFENSSYDYSKFECKFDNMQFNYEVSFINWKNKFSLEIIGEKGILKVNSLKKWKNSTLEFLQRIYPSGKPIRTLKKYNGNDVSFKNDIKYFESLIENKNHGNIEETIQINKILNHISKKNA